MSEYIGRVYRNMAYGNRYRVEAGSSPEVLTLVSMQNGHVYHDYIPVEILDECFQFGLTVWEDDDDLPLA